MLGPDRSDGLVSPHHPDRRPSVAFDSIWSTPRMASQRLFALVPSSAMLADSPARPPPTPLVQASFEDALRLAAPRCGSRPEYPASQATDTDAAGLGLLGVLPADSAAIKDAFHARRYSMDYQHATHSPGQRAARVASADESPLQTGLAVCSMLPLPRMSFPSTPNTASQNVLPLFHHAVEHSPLRGYDGVAHVPRLYDLLPYNNYPHSLSGLSALPHSPVCLEDCACLKNDPAILAHIGGFSGLHFQTGTPSHKIPVYPRGCAPQMRGHFRAEALVGTNDVDLAPNYCPEQIEADQMEERVSLYFSYDPHRRVRITLGSISSSWQHEAVSSEFVLPRFAGGEDPEGCKLAFVAFKSGRLDVFYIPENSVGLQDLQVDDLVIVEADRGSDLGKVARLDVSREEARRLKMLNHLEHLSFFAGAKDLHADSFRSRDSKTKSCSAGQPLQLETPKAIFSVAQRSVVKNIIRKLQDEESACQITIAAIAEITGTSRRNPLPRSLPPARGDSIDQMQIVDAEYQFDRRKLTIYFCAQRRVNFRDLLPELFKLFKARIWLEPLQGIPYKFNKDYTESRHGGTQRNEKSKGCHGRIKGSSRNASQPLSLAQGSDSRATRAKQSPEVRSLPWVIARKAVHGNTNSTQDSDAINAKADFREQMKKCASLPFSRGPKGGSEQRSIKSSADEEKCVMTSLVDTLNH